MQRASQYCPQGRVYVPSCSISACRGRPAVRHPHSQGHLTVVAIVSTTVGLLAGDGGDADGCDQRRLTEVKNRQSGEIQKPPGTILLCAAIAQSIDQYGEGEGRLAPTRVVEVIA